MGDLIQFPVKKREPERPALNERLARIRAKLDEINKLMEKLKHDNPRERPDSNRRSGPEHTD